MTKEIQLTQGKVALVDDEDFEYLNQWKWHFKDGYAARGVWLKSCVYMHREIIKTPVGLDTDHIDRNKLNNQKENLRYCTKSENQRNRKKSSNNSSGYRGVVLDKRRNKWMARIQHCNKYIFIGYFTTAKEAGEAYKNKAKLLFGDFFNGLE